MNQCFVTRKPLLDKFKNVVAYEILFRDSNGLRPDAVPITSPGEALATFLSTGTLRQLAGEKIAVINLGPDLVKEYITALIPKEKTILGVSDGDPSRTRC